MDFWMNIFFVKTCNLSVSFLVFGSSAFAMIATSRAKDYGVSVCTKEDVKKKIKGFEFFID